MRRRLWAVTYAGLLAAVCAIGCRTAESGGPFAGVRAPFPDPNAAEGRSLRESDSGTIHPEEAADEIERAGRTVETIPTTSETSARASGWSRLFGRFGKPKRIPLPRTDAAAAAANPDASAFGDPADF